MKTAVLVSGGVDSSVALARLLAQGESALHAFYLQIWLEEQESFLGECPFREDLKYVQAVCSQFTTPLDIIPLQKEYYARVVDYVISELRQGYTPSPDIFCNSRIKFGAFLECIGSKFAKVATGHYAQVEKIGEKYYLKCAPDPVKDQTYFLSHLTQEQLSRIIFPIGDLHKSEVRALAREYDLPNKDRKDSQGICFLGKIKFSEFVKVHLGEQDGEIREQGTERVLGTHHGYWFHTIGQRKGLDLPGGPWFVVRKDLLQNIVYVAHLSEIEKYQRDELLVGDLHWITERPTETHLRCKLRHTSHFYDCDLQWVDNEKLHLRLSERDQGVAPGQFATFYDGEYCLGAGRILA